MANEKVEQPFPRMLYRKEYVEHINNQHDLESERKRRSHTTLAQDPDDLEEKLTSGWAESPAEFLPDGQDRVQAPAQKFSTD